MQQTIQQLNPRHFKIIELCLAGMTISQIAEHLGMHKQTVSIVFNSPCFQHELSIRRSRLTAMTDERIVSSQDAIAETIRAGAKDAIDKILGSIHSDNERIALSASQDVLDRAGYPRISRMENKSVSININSIDAAIIAESLSLDVDDDDDDNNATVEISSNDTVDNIENETVRAETSDTIAATQPATGLSTSPQVSKVTKIKSAQLTSKVGAGFGAEPHLL